MNRSKNQINLLDTWTMVDVTMCKEFEDTFVQSYQKVFLFCEKLLPIIADTLNGISRKYGGGVKHCDTLVRR